MSAPVNEKRPWSSKVVVVSLFSASSALSGCGDADGGERRNMYETRAACEADYSARECEQQARSGGGGGFFFLGPLYAGNWRSRGAAAYAGGGGPGRAALSSPEGTVSRATTTQRGGFGTTGRSYSSRGG
jgi:hypothetical protein